MPRANNNMIGEEWKICDRCGFIHPLSMLTKQLGRLLCRDHGCLDDLSNMYRQKQIVEAQKGPEGQSDLPELMSGPDEVIFG